MISIKRLRPGKVLYLVGDDKSLFGASNDCIQIRVKSRFGDNVIVEYLNNEAIWRYESINIKEFKNFYEVKTWRHRVAENNRRNKNGKFIK